MTLIVRTPIIDDDGTGTYGTILDNAWKQELYNQIDAAGGPNAPTNSPVFTGDPQAPTPPPGDNDTSLATTAFVMAGIKRGAWTPTIIADGGGTVSGYTKQSGIYVNVFGAVTAMFDVILNGKGTLTGNVQVGNMPFPLMAGSPDMAIGVMWEAIGPNISMLFAHAGATGVVAYLHYVPNPPNGNAFSNTLNASLLTNTFRCQGTLVYQTNYP